MFATICESIVILEVIGGIIYLFRDKIKAWVGGKQ